MRAVTTFLGGRGGEATLAGALLASGGGRAPQKC
jgi:hypothetical protein